MTTQQLEGRLAEVLDERDAWKALYEKAVFGCGLIGFIAGLIIPHLNILN